jgi:hypothetical protein
MFMRIDSFPVHVLEQVDAGRHLIVVSNISFLFAIQFFFLGSAGLHQLQLLPHQSLGATLFIFPRSSGSLVHGFLFFLGNRPGACSRPSPLRCGLTGPVSPGFPASLLGPRVQLCIPNFSSSNRHNLFFPQVRKRIIMILVDKLLVFWPFLDVHLHTVPFNFGMNY